VDNKSKNFGVGGYKGRIIFLGDGTEVLTDSDDAEMFDNSEEDKDLATQVSKKATVDGDDGKDPLPRAPSPPPRGTKKQEEPSKAGTGESTQKETLVNEAAKESTEGGSKTASSSASKD
jgi:protein phosphatase 2C family protein 2/3